MRPCAIGDDAAGEILTPSRLRREPDWSTTFSITYSAAPFIREPLSEGGKPVVPRRPTKRRAK